MSEKQQGLRHKERRKTAHQRRLSGTTFYAETNQNYINRGKIIHDDGGYVTSQQFHAMLDETKPSSSVSSSSSSFSFPQMPHTPQSSSPILRYLEGEGNDPFASIPTPAPPPPRDPPTTTSGRTQQNNTAVDGTLTILVLLTVIFCFVWSPSLIRRCDPRYQERRRLRSAARAAQQAAEEAALAAVMSGDSDALPGGVNISPVLPHGMSEEDRRDYVSNVLVTKKVVASPNKENDTNASSLEPYTIERNKSDLVITPSSPQAASPADQYSENICAICLLEYEEGDEICWSHNKQCNHAFHRECILEWLMRHDDCPCCRHNYLTLDDNVEEGNGEEGENGNDTDGIDARSGDRERGDATTRGDSNSNSNRSSVQSGIFRRHLLPNFLSGSPRQNNQTTNNNNNNNNTDGAVELTTAGTTGESPVSTTPAFANEPEGSNHSGDADTTVVTEDSVNAESTNVSPTRARFLARLRFINSGNNAEEGSDAGPNPSQGLPEVGVVDEESGQESHVSAENVRSRQEESSNGESNLSSQVSEGLTTDETNEAPSTEVESTNAADDDGDNDAPGNVYEI